MTAGTVCVSVAAGKPTWDLHLHSVCVICGFAMQSVCVYVCVLYLLVSLHVFWLLWCVYGPVCGLIQMYVCILNGCSSTVVVVVIVVVRPLRQLISLGLAWSDCIYFEPFIVRVYTSARFRFLTKTRYINPLLLLLLLLFWPPEDKRSHVETNH